VFDHGQVAVCDIRAFQFNDQVSSFILVNRFLTLREIARIQARARAPRGFVEIFNTGS
jgi:hypothetical protein